MRRRPPGSRSCGGLAALVAAATVLASVTSATAQPQVAWQQWQHQVGIVDLGVRSDGALAAMIAGRLFTISPATGAASPFASGPGGFSADPNAEPYFVVAQPLSVDGASCSWTADDLFILDLTTPPGLARVDAAGQSTRFATFSGVDTLGGIAQDTTGGFGHRLLVTGTHDSNQTTVFAVGCDGSVSVITTSAPLVEGGPAVAPPTFGRFAADLIASDENTGQVWAIDPTGSAFLVLVSGLPSGGDTGVESEGFVPPGFFSSSGDAYLSDRGTANNPFPGTDSLLRLSAADLSAAGVQEGDLLDAAEGGGTTEVIRCAASCSVVTTLQGTPGGHIEGHIAFSTP